MPRRPKNNTGLIIGVIALILVGMCVLAIASVSWFGFQAARSVGPIAACATTYEALHDALQAYTREHDGKLPSAANWQAEMKPYLVKSLEATQKEFEGADKFLKMKFMDPDGEWGCYLDDKGTMSGIAFNADLSGKKVDEIASKATTPIFFEIEKPAANAAMTYKDQDPAKSPTIFGEKRGWFVVTWEDVDSIGSEGRRTNVETGNRSVRVETGN
jgi:hypothetical protein